jgi:amino acid transporter
MILDYVLIPLLSAVYVSITAARLVPEVPYAVWALLFTLTITFVNVRGIQVTARASEVMTVIMTASTILFVACAIHFIVKYSGLSGLFVSQRLIDTRTLRLSPLMLGAGVATLSYIGS